MHVGEHVIARQHLVCVCVWVVVVVVVAVCVWVWWWGEGWWGGGSACQHVMCTTAPGVCACVGGGGACDVYFNAERDP